VTSIPNSSSIIYNNFKDGNAIPIKIAAGIRVQITSTAPPSVNP